MSCFFYPVAKSEILDLKYLAISHPAHKNDARHAKTEALIYVGVKAARQQPVARRAGASG